MFPLFKIITSQKKLCDTTQNTATPSGNNAMKFSTEVSEAHAAARVKGPETVDVDNKARMEAVQQLLLNSLWTCDILRTFCRRGVRIHTFLARGSTLAN